MSEEAEHPGKESVPDSEYAEYLDYPQHVTGAWAEWRKLSASRLAAWEDLSDDQRQRFARVIAVAIDSKPQPAMRLTVTSGQYSDGYRLIADNWQRDEHAGLVITRNRLVVAEFCPGQWIGVIDEAHRDPDALKVARDGLDNIRHAIRQATGLTSEDGDRLYEILRRVDELADKAHSASYQHDGDPF